MSRPRFDELLIIIVLATLIAALLLQVTIAGEREIYITETNSFKHNPSDPIYLSIADDNVIVRLWISREMVVKNAYVVVGQQDYVMKPHLPLTDGVLWYGAVPHTGVGFNYYFKVVLENEVIYVKNTRYQSSFIFDVKRIYPQVTWVTGRVGYQIFPERFYNGDAGNDQYALIYDSFNYDNTTTAKPVLSKWNDPPLDLLMHCCHQYYGGDFRGITMKLDYLKELGVGLIYLNPIFISGSAHGYDTYDHMKVDPKFGRLEDLMELIEEAKKRDIKVIFDFVPGHVGLGHWAFQDVYVNGPRSRYWNWFTIYRYPFTPGDGRDYRCWWGVGTLPQLNTSNPEVRRYLINVAIYWLEKGFDGMRIDTPLDLLDGRSFFEELRREVKSRFPEAYIVGEIWSVSPDWVNRGPFDTLMNYPLGMGILVEYGQGKLNGVGRDHVSGRLAEYFASYSVSAVGMGFNNIGTHDTDRVLTMLGGGDLWSTPGHEPILRLKMVSTLQYTMPGMPVIFQGDERGLTGRSGFNGGRDEQRYPIQWDRLNKEVYEHYKQIGWIKNNVEALHTSIIRVLETTGSVLAYTRGYNDEVLVVANNDRSPVKFTLPEGEWTLLYSSSGAQPEIQGSSITIPPLTALVLLNSEHVEEEKTQTGSTQPGSTRSTPTPSTATRPSTPPRWTESPVTNETSENASGVVYGGKGGDLSLVILTAIAAVVLIALTISIATFSRSKAGVKV